MSVNEDLRMQIKESAHRVADKVLETLEGEQEEEKEDLTILSELKPEEADLAIAGILRKYAEIEDRFLERFTDAQCARDELIKALEEDATNENTMEKVHLTRTYYESVLGVVDDLTDSLTIIPDVLLEYFEYHEYSSPEKEAE